jgi:hypothetical protein
MEVLAISAMGNPLVTVTPQALCSSLALHYNLRISVNIIMIMGYTQQA